MTKIRLWIYGAVAFVAALVGAWLHILGRRHEQRKADRRNTSAMKEAKEIRHDLQTSDDQRLIDILSGRVRK
jgi:membrane protein DedA with SNARE-associated domain